MKIKLFQNLKFLTFKVTQPNQTNNKKDFFFHAKKPLRNVALV